MASSNDEALEIMSKFFFTACSVVLKQKVEFWIDISLIAKILGDFEYYVIRQ